MRGSPGLRAFHGIRLYFVPVRPHDCFLIPVSDAADARCAFQPGQFRFLHGLLFDCGREQLMHSLFRFPRSFVWLV